MQVRIINLPKITDERGNLSFIENGDLLPFKIERTFWTYDVPTERNSDKHICSSVTLEDNVFVGSNSKILKGVSIGENSIVANSSVVTKSFPGNVIIGGNPAKVISVIA
jgi:acetyltransferase-like isoleucine patch superfamily enzyme